jgi:nucleoside-diphosphate-sugar epimerase
VDGTKCLLDAAVNYNIGRFVMTSTTSVYGCTTRAKGEAIWVTEELAPNPEDVYDETKLEAEDLCREAARSGLSTAVLRVSRCFPEREDLLAFYRLYRGVDRRDVAEGHLVAASRVESGFELFNLSSVSPFKCGDCEKLWIDPWGVIDERLPSARDTFDRMGWRLRRRIDRVYVIEKMVRKLGFSPRYDFEAFVADLPHKQRGPD